MRRKKSNDETEETLRQEQCLKNQQSPYEEDDFDCNTEDFSLKSGAIGMVMSKDKALGEGSEIYKEYLIIFMDLSKMDIN